MVYLIRCRGAICGRAADITMILPSLFPISHPIASMCRSLIGASSRGPCGCFCLCTYGPAALLSDKILLKTHFHNQKSHHLKGALMGVCIKDAINAPGLSHKRKRNIVIKTYYGITLVAMLRNTWASSLCSLCSKSKCGEILFGLTWVRYLCFFSLLSQDEGSY